MKETFKSIDDLCAHFNSKDRVFQIQALIVPDGKIESNPHPQRDQIGRIFTKLVIDKDGQLAVKYVQSDSKKHKIMRGVTGIVLENDETIACETGSFLKSSVEDKAAGFEAEAPSKASADDKTKLSKPPASDLDRHLAENWKYLMRYSLKLHRGHAANADDLMQDTALRISKAYENFKGNSTFKTWATTVMKRTFLSALEKSSTQKRGAGVNVLSLCDEIEHPVERKEASPERLTQAREAYDAVREFIENMPEQTEKQRVQKEVLTLILVEGLTLTEAAAKVGQKANTIRGSLCRWRQDNATHFDGVEEEHAFH